MKPALSLTELKEWLARTHSPREYWSCSALKVGIPKGAITEISGCGKTELTVQFLRENPNLRVAWVEEKFSVFPFGFLQRQVDLDRVLFVEGGEDTEWSMLQVLKSQAFPVVVAYLEKTDVRTVRRWQLACEKAAVSLVWLSPKPQAHWPVSLQVQVERDDEALAVRVLKRRA